MNTSALEITNSDQTTNLMTIYRQSDQLDLPVFVIFPAMGVRASYYEPFAENLAQKKAIVITIDLRGNGNSSVRPSKSNSFGYAEMIAQDYHTAISTIKNQFPTNQLILLGHSLGGQIGALYMTKYPSQIDKLILIASCSVYYNSYPGTAALKTLFFTQLFGRIASVLGYFPGKKIGFGGIEAKGVMKDWSQQARTGKYILANDSFDYEQALGSLAIEVLAISFKKDNLAPKSAVEHLYGKFKKGKIKHLDIDKDEKSGTIFNHYNWVKNPDLLTELIKKWLNEGYDL